MTNSQTPHGRGQYTHLEAAMIIAAALISASILYATSISATVTKTEVSTSTSITTRTAISITTVTVTPTASTNTSTSVQAAILAICSQDEGGPGDVLVASTNLAAVICFQLYYYNSTAPLTLNTTQAFSIQRQYASNVNSFSGAANFTVTPSQSELTIGGPANENEGAVIGYAITAKSGASGTYPLLYLPTAYPTGWLLTPAEPLFCAHYAQLVAGTGQPNYVQPTSCATYRSSNFTPPLNSSNSHSIPGISIPLPNGNVGFEIIDVTNSTQISGLG